jgi:AraC-like DNA-binding protein
VGHCQKLMKSGAVDRLNMHGLAFECGFHNRNSFTTAFKKFTGRTPSDYLKSLSRSALAPGPDLPSIINTGVYNP